MKRKGAMLKNPFDVIYLRGVEPNSYTYMDKSSFFIWDR